jgi:hypothetical protein
LRARRITPPLGGLDDEHVAVVGACVARVVGAALGVAVGRDRHVERHRVAVGTAAAVAVRGRGDRPARGGGVGDQERHREVDLEPVAVAPAAEAGQRADDGLRAL